ncbi:MAG: carboxypeptidase-like regulatory domain-containing protein [Ilumatobacteraceae bacterium]
MKTDLALSHLEVTPGQTGRVAITVTNNADVIDGVTAIVDGINPDWIRLERPLISLFPEASDQLELVLDIPTTCPAGDYLVITRIVSTIDADRQSVHDFWLTVTPQPGLAITLVPRIITGGGSATIVATVANTGNTSSEVMIDALEPTREVDCTPEPSNVVIPQDHDAEIDITMRGKRPWFGDPVSRSITVTARVDDLVVEEIGTFRQKPKIPRGVLTALILASIILLWALIFLFVVTELRRTEPPAKAVGAGFMTGPDNIPLSRVAATAEGTVTASTTGQGVPRITVEAMRITSDGLLESVGSAATDDEGAFSLKSLIPGNYKLRYSADGYQTLWFDGAGDASTADVVALDPLETRDDLNIEMSGNTGRLLGQIAVPPDADGVPLTVTATLLTERPDGTTGPAEGVTIPPLTTTDGVIDMSGLPTPGTYQITVTGPGFQTQQFEQTLAGGETTVMNTVQITAATGTIEGTVRDGNGQPLGGVAVTARSGDLVVKSVTPTSGNVGQFQIVGLATPQTYSISFDLPNYTSTTIALSLSAGQNRTGLAVQLIGGSGTVAGVAVDATGQPVGGAKVVVLGDGVNSETTTLTTGSDAGTFTVSDLPVPGVYTVSIEAAGFQTETLSASFSAGGPQNLGQITLISSTAQVAGTVSGPNGGLGGVTISLSDGTPLVRTTTSATNPAGSYAFTSTPPGAYTLTFERSGFATKVILISVTAGVNGTYNTTLAAAP